MYIFQLASQHAEWLAARQAVTAANIANADTPGYRGGDITPFEMVLDKAQLSQAITQPGHMTAPESRFASLEVQPEQAWDVTYSGNNVSLESELLKVSENGRMQALDTGISKIFHRMILSSLKV